MEKAGLDCIFQKSLRKINKIFYIIKSIYKTIYNKNMYDVYTLE